MYSGKAFAWSNRKYTLALKLAKAQQMDPIKLAGYDGRTVKPMLHKGEIVELADGTQALSEEGFEMLRAYGHSDIERRIVPLTIPTYMLAYVHRPLAAKKGPQRVPRTRAADAA